MWTIRCVNAADQENPILVDGVFKTINNKQNMYYTTIDRSVTSELIIILLHLSILSGIHIEYSKCNSQFK